MKKIIIISIVAFLLWWFNRKFEVTFKYNNDLDNYVVKVKYNSLINEDDVKKDLKNGELKFAGYYETYYLNGEEIEKIKKDSNLEACICKDGFKINEDKTKCIGKEKFDFKNTKIVEKKTIEALWTKEVVKEEVEETPQEATPAPVDNTDYGSIGLSASSACIIGDGTISVTANVNNAIDKTINWNVSKCFGLNGDANSKSVNRVCNLATTEAGVITASLNNGQSASVNVSYEPKIFITVFDGNGQISADSNGEYLGGNVTIRTNTNATFSGNYIKSTTPNSVTLHNSSDSLITITTACGQSTTVKINALIN